MVTIRLRRMGFRNQPTYRVVVIDSRKTRDGKYIESIGHYNPRKKILKIDSERAQYWLSQGAQPSATAGRLIRRYARQNPAPVSPVSPEPVAETKTEPTN